MIPTYASIKTKLLTEMADIIKNAPDRHYERAAVHFMWRLYMITTGDRVKYSLITEEDYLNKYDDIKVYERLEREMPYKMHHNKFNDAKKWYSLLITGKLDPYLSGRDERVIKYRENKERPEEKEIRKAEILRTNGICPLCGEVADALDHIYPVKFFPQLDLEPLNRMICCSECNNDKSDKLPFNKHLNIYKERLKQINKKYPNVLIHAYELIDNNSTEIWR